MITLGIQDLLARDLADSEPVKCRGAVDNCLLPITSGMETIGDLMGHCEDEGLSAETIRSIGWLLAFLSNLSGELQFIGAQASYVSSKLLNGAARVES